MQWKILDTGVASAAQNMAIDQQLLEELTEDAQPVLHLYDWAKDSATYGYFADPSQYINSNGPFLDLGRRPTGGGILFHLWDLAYSIVIPASHPSFSINTLNNYAFVNTLVARTITQWHGTSATLLQKEPIASESCYNHFCMAKPTQYDVMINGKKVGGGAQRRTRKGFLHQGSISLAMPDPYYLNKIFLPGNTIVEAMTANSFALLEGRPSQSQLVYARKDLRQALIKRMKDES